VTARICDLKKGLRPDARNGKMRSPNKNRDSAMCSTGSDVLGRLAQAPATRSPQGVRSQRTPPLPTILADLEFYACVLRRPANNKRPRLLDVHSRMMPFGRSRASVPLFSSSEPESISANSVFLAGGNPQQIAAASIEGPQSARRRAKCDLDEDLSLGSSTAVAGSCCTASMYAQGVLILAAKAVDRSLPSCTKRTEQ